MFWLFNSSVGYGIYILAPALLIFLIVSAVVLSFSIFNGKGINSLTKTSLIMGAVALLPFMGALTNSESIGDLLAVLVYLLIIFTLSSIYTFTIQFIVFKIVKK